MSPAEIAIIALIVIGVIAVAHYLLHRQIKKTVSVIVNPAHNKYPTGPVPYPMPYNNRSDFPRQAYKGYQDGNVTHYLINSLYANDLIQIQANGKTWTINPCQPIQADLPFQLSFTFVGIMAPPAVGLRLVDYMTEGMLSQLELEIVGNTGVPQIVPTPNQCPLLTAANNYTGVHGMSR